MSTVLDLPLVDGPVPPVLTVLAAAAVAGLLVLPRGGRRRAVAAGVGVLVAVLLGVLANPLIVHLVRLFPQELPLEVVAWGAAGIGGLALAVVVIVRARWGRALIAGGCALVVVLGAATQINVYYARYGTLGELVGPGPQVAALSAVQQQLPATTEPAAPTTATPTMPASAAPAAPASAAPTTTTARPAPDDPARSGPETTPVVTRWNGRVAGKGTVAQTPIPGTVSRFPARDGFVYLPPAYSPTGPRLPVMVLVAGQPGGPGDWLTAGKLAAQLDRFAAEHGGLAPVAVVVDPTGSDFANTACIDSRIGNAETYLATDVPEWVRTHLRVDTNPAHWTFAGFSFGGTCALQLATRFPKVYGSFVDLQGEQEPSVAPTRAQTVDTLFGGDTEAFDEVVPMTLLARRHYPDTWGYLAAGGKDAQFMGYMTAVAEAAARAGMKVRAVPVPNQGHSWAVPQGQLGPALDWLSPRLGFTA